MQITIELPDNIADRLQPANVSRRVLELIAADHYLQGRIPKKGKTSDPLVGV
jgi:hypothetical protein